MTDPVKKPKQVDIEFAEDTQQIVLPKGMSHKDARLWLERDEERLEKVVGINRIYNAFALDGGHAFARAISMVFGFASPVPTPTMFGPVPPQMISFDTGEKVPTEVPWGRVQIPGIHGFLNAGFTHDQSGFPQFRVTGEIKMKSKEKVDILLNKTADLIRDSSVYRGRALRVRYRDDEGDVYKEFSPLYAPSFMHPTLEKEDVIFDAQTMREVDDYIFTPIQYAAACKKVGVPIKRGILLYGEYGVGKTMVGAVLATLCERHRVTFVDLQDARDIHRAVQFALKYPPALVWAEDIDKAVGLDRDASVDQILNTIDGVDAKDNHLMVAVTSNHIEKIHAAMKRPGRFDAIIQVPAPDAEAALKLVLLYGRGLVDETDPQLEQVGLALAGRIPALTREAVERAKLSAIRRTEGDPRIILTAEDLLVAANSLTKHMKAMEHREESVPIHAKFEIGGHVHEGGLSLTRTGANGEDDD
jgi:transitional endoplasmic reticulum ATPase